jgi:TPR repeat protein
MYWRLGEPHATLTKALNRFKPWKTSSSPYSLCCTQHIPFNLGAVFMSDLEFDLSSGLQAFEARNFSKALQLLTPLAEDGNPEAQYRLGMIYQNGLGKVKNLEYAKKYMSAAAQQNHAYAQHGLGVMYLYGEGVEKDESKALEWFRKAAEQGLSGSQMTLGMMYENGQGVEKNEVEARRWYKMAEQNS